MDAREFFTKLEYRICREIDRLRDVELQGLWCDGVIPEDSTRADGRPLVTGRAWMGRGARHQEKWRFEFVLPPGTCDPDEASWDALFPPEDATGWLELRPSEQIMRINPMACEG
jgi:hypothetical protein